MQTLDEVTHALTDRLSRGENATRGASGGTGKTGTTTWPGSRRKGSSPSRSGPGVEGAEYDAAGNYIPLAERGRTIACERCLDMGFVALDVPVGHPDFGRTVVCPDCGGGPVVAEARVRRAQRTLRMLEEAGLTTTSRHDWLTWHDFEASVLEELGWGKETAIAVARDWAAGLPVRYDEKYGKGFSRRMPTTFEFAEYNSIWFTGRSGVGKTGLAYLAYKTRLALAGDTGVFVEWVDLYEAIRSTYGKSGDLNPSYSLLETVASAPVLLLDDVGHARRRAPMTDDQYDKLWQIVNRRYTQRLPTLITSNLDRDQLRAQTDSKLVGRLAEMCVIVEMAGADLREYEDAPGDEDDGR